MSGPAPGRLRPTSAATLAVAVLVGVLVGGSVAPLVERGGGIVPRVPWSAVLTLAFLAVVLMALAWNTWRSLRRPGPRIEAHRAVNLFVLGRSCALVGAAVCGGYAAFALGFLGNDAALPQERLVRGLLAAGSAALVVVGGLALERACQVPGSRDEERQDDDDDEDAPRDQTSS